MIEDGFEDYLKTYEAGRALFKQGDPGESFYVIKDGLIGIIRRERGVENQIATIGPGEVLGELSLVDPNETKTRSTAAETITTVSCWQFTRKQFDQLIDQNKSFRNKILSHLASRLRQTTGELADANRVENQLYEASFSLLHTIAREQLYSDKRHELSVDPSVKSLSSLLSITPEKLKIYLSAPTLEQLGELPEEKEETARDVARILVKKAQEQIDFQTPFTGEFDHQTSVTQNHTNLRDICRAAERLNNKMKQDTDQLTRQIYDQIWNEFDLIKNRLKKARQDPDADQTLTRRLNAFVKGIRKKLQKVNEKTFSS